MAGLHICNFYKELCSETHVKNFCGGARFVTNCSDKTLDIQFY